MEPLEENEIKVSRVIDILQALKILTRAGRKEKVGGRR